jgi:hypothetical protein
MGVFYQYIWERCSSKTGNIQKVAIQIGHMKLLGVRGAPIFRPLIETILSN